ncbi:MAG: TIGR00282 family metallophosphoesterase [Planctomycetia bacterium]|nr:TIGR00282 family metallophosphoesterase [Planctomycetia bacterium]
MRFLHIGDIVGRPGRKLVCALARKLKEAYGLEFITANAENAAAGSGLNLSIYRELIESGVDCVTMGDHTFKRREIIPVLERESQIVRPANYPPEAPGKGMILLNIGMGARCAVINLLGRVFMQPVDCPFHAVDKILRLLPADVRVIVVDFHAEATSDKQIMGRYLDGRVTAVLGTHTHVATADEQILPRGTAFQCDVGMAGPMESIIGRQIDRVTETTLTARPTLYEVASNDVRIYGTIVDFNPISGRALAIQRLVAGEAGVKISSTSALVYEHTS